MPSSNAKGRFPARALSVSRHTSPRIDLNPLGLPSVNGDAANSAVAIGCSASPTRSFFTMSASPLKSRFTWIVHVRYIMSSPSAPTFGM